MSGTRSGRAGQTRLSRPRGEQRNLSHNMHGYQSQTRGRLPIYTRSVGRHIAVLAAFLVVGLLAGVSLDFQDGDFGFCDQAGAGHAEISASLPPLMTHGATLLSQHAV